MSVKTNAFKSVLLSRVIPSDSKKGFSFYDKLAFLYLLNIIDWLCTEALLLSGRFYEANPLMSTFITEFWQTFIIKVLLPLVITVLCSVIFKLSGAEELRFADVLIYIGIVIYALLNVWHIFNFVLLFFVF